MDLRNLVVCDLTEEAEWTAFRTTDRAGKEANAHLSRTAELHMGEGGLPVHGYILRLGDYEPVHMAPDAIVAFGERYVLVRRTEGLADGCAVVESFRYRMARAYEAWEALPDGHHGQLLTDGPTGKVLFRVLRAPMVTTRMRALIVEEATQRYAPVWADRWEDALRNYRETGIIPPDCRAIVRDFGEPDPDEDDDGMTETIEHGALLVIGPEGDNG